MHLLRKRSTRRGAVATVLAAGALLLGSVGPAAAAGPGAGVFTGYEDAPNSVLYTLPPPLPPLPSPTLCAKFTPTSGTPLRETLLLKGTFNGGAAVVDGTATFTNSTNDYDANPVGTFAPNSQCVGAPYAVRGTLSITVTAAGINCTGTANAATYTRTASSAIVITGSCTSASGTTVTLTATGVEVPCPEPVFPAGCPGVPPYAGHDAILAGTYVQTSP